MEEKLFERVFPTESIGSVTMTGKSQNHRMVEMNL